MKKIIIPLLFLFNVLCIAQNNKTTYSIGYLFKEGIYISISDFTNNRPIPTTLIKSQLPKNQINFLDEVVKQKEITYYDSTGLEKKISSDKIWGYCQNNIIHIYYNKRFARINAIGTLSQFAAIETSTVTYQAPMYMGMPGYGFGTTTSTVDEMKPFILDTRNNSVVEFTEKNLETLMMDDNTLYNEFVKLKHRKKKESLFIYLRKYNDKHPLYLPIN